MTVDQAVEPLRNGRHRELPDGTNHQVPEVLRSVLNRIAVGGPVPSAALAEAFEASMNVAAPIRDVALGSLMTATMMRGPRVDDVEALLQRALVVDDREQAVVVGDDGSPVLLLAGSGKKGLRTANVTTPAALVAAAAGVRVVKVGSAGTSSVLGSRDLVHELGLRECRTTDEIRSALAVTRFAFVPVEPTIPQLDEIYGGRFHAPNPFSFGLGLLASPVRGDVAVFGLAHPRVDVAAEVLTRFGFNAVDVVSTLLPDGTFVDEVWPVGEVQWCRVRDGRPALLTVDVRGDGAVLGMPVAPANAEQAVTEVVGLLDGGGLEQHRAVVVLNAAHLLVLGEVVSTLAEGLNLARDVLRDGVALATVERR